jgi:hypothetical protein
MSKLISYLLRWLSVVYSPHPEERTYLNRAQTQSDNGLEVTTAVLSDRESARFFGVRMARKGMQPVWVRIINRTDTAFRLDLFSLDPAYYMPLEAAYINHFAMGKRLLGFGALAWMFLPLLPLLPLKFFGARRANRQMNAFFKAHGFRTGLIRPGDDRSGFVFTALNEGVKNINIKLASAFHTRELAFMLEVPGLALRSEYANAADSKELQEAQETTLRAWLEHQPRCTTNRRGDREGDPLNLVVAGDYTTILQCFGARWDQAETITAATCWKTMKAFLFEAEYRYAPVSPLYLDGKRQELALQKARTSINERLHLRLWRAPLAFQGQPVWIGQISRDIGVRFTFRTWNLTTHRIDSDIDEARDYVIDYLLANGRAVRVGYVGGVDAAPQSAPRYNLTGDPYVTDGLRAVMVLTSSRAQPSFFSWA